MSELELGCLLIFKRVGWGRNGVLGGTNKASIRLFDDDDDDQVYRRMATTSNPTETPRWGRGEFRCHFLFIRKGIY